MGNFISMFYKLGWGGEIGSNCQNYWIFYPNIKVERYHKRCKVTNDVLNHPLNVPEGFHFHPFCILYTLCLKYSIKTYYFFHAPNAETHKAWWGYNPTSGCEVCILPSHTNFKPFFSRTILTLWTVRNKTAAKHYWKHFQLFTRLKGWNDTLNTSDFIVWAIFWWQSGIDLSKCWKLTIFQKVIIWLKALKLRAKKRCTFFSPFKSSYNLIKTIPSCPVIKTLILRYCSLPNILTFKCYEVLEEKNLC